MSNLLRLIKYKNYSVKNVKEEALVLVHHLLEQYINAVKEKIDKPLISQPSKEDEKYILDTVVKIHSYLKEKIISADLMDSILEISLKEKQYVQQSMILEPIAFFYDILTTSYTNNLNILKKDDNGNIFWIPELLAFSIINDLKEKGYIFNKFKYINEVDLIKIMNIYNKTSIQIVKEKPISVSFLKANKDTPIRAIQDMSLIMVDKLIDSKYIDNNKSKKTKRKKKNGRG